MRTVDLFCGCGRMSLGFQMNGYEIVGAFDFWHPAIECYSVNLEHPTFYQDLSKKNLSLKLIHLLALELIIGGRHVRIFQVPEDAKKAIVLI